MTQLNRAEAEQMVSSLKVDLTSPHDVVKSITRHFDGDERKLLLAALRRANRKAAERRRNHARVQLRAWIDGQRDEQEGNDAQ